MRNLYVIFMLAAAALSCGRIGEPEESGGGVLSFRMDTRGAAASPGTLNTYRVMLYNADFNQDRYSFMATGTYYENSDTPGAILIPCRLSKDGVFINDNEDEAEILPGRSSEVLISLVHPGISNEGGGFRIDPEKAFFSTAAESRLVRGYEPIALDSVLRDTRARLAFEFYKLKSDNVNDYTISNLKILGAGNDGDEMLFYPATRQCIPILPDGQEETGRAIKDLHVDGVNEIELIRDGKVERFITCCTTDIKDDAADDFYLPAAFYVSKEEVGRLLKTQYDTHIQPSGYLTLGFSMVQAGRNINVEIPLTSLSQNPELESGHCYTYKILVKSNYINVYMSVSELEDGTNGWNTPPGPGGENAMDEIVSQRALGSFVIGDDAAANKWTEEPLEDQIIEWID